MIHKSWKIGKVDNENIAVMLSHSPVYYRERLKKLGFFGKNKILLDAGCGAGHWAIAASFLNNQVFGIDITEKYLNVARALKKNFHRQNINLKLGRIEHLPYQDNFFDFIICYSVWMFTDKEKALAEFARVLKPGGKLYLGSLTGKMWYPRLIWKGLKQGDFQLIWSSLKAISQRIPLNPVVVRQLLEKQGFQIIEFNADGKIGQKNIKVKPIYNDKIWGIWEIFEILAQKN